MRARFLLPALALIAALAACKQDEAQDISPRAFTAETLGHYCQMNLLEHEGPKGQVILEGMEPLFFSQARDVIAYARAPEQIAPILAIYVSDMGAPGASWDDPGTDNWIAAEDAYFVIGSTREGGMGAPETVPFASEAAARAFAAGEGGEIRRLAEIPDEMVLTPAEDDSPISEDDIRGRLRALSPIAGG